MYTYGIAHGQPAIDDPSGGKHAKRLDSTRAIPLPDANAYGENRLPAVGRTISSHPTRLRRGSGLVHEAALPVVQERRRLAFGQGPTKRRSNMNRHESRALPESLGVIVREYLKSFPDPETFADGPESQLLSARTPGRGEGFL